MHNARPDEAGRYSMAMVLAVAIAVALLAGCSREAPTTDPDELRIVSFMPSATRIVVDLGLGDRIVGVAEHDAAAPAMNADGDPMPIVGHFMDVDVERLLSLRPTHVIFPETEQNRPAALTRFADRGGQVVTIAYPTTLGNVTRSVQELGKSLGQAQRGLVLADSLTIEFQRREQFQAVVEHIQHAFDDMEGGGKIPRTRPSVLLAFSVDPLVASGPGSINDELLTLAGAINAVGDGAVSAVTLDREALIDTNPEVIVLLLPGASDAEAARKIAWFDGLSIAAVEKGRMHVVTDPQVLLPATNVIETLSVFEELFRNSRSETSAAKAAGYAGESVER